MKVKLIQVLVLGALTAAACPGQSCKPNELLLSGDCWPQVLNVGGRAVAAQVVWPRQVGRNPDGTPVWKCPSDYVLYLLDNLETCQNATPSPFASFRRSLIGVNAVARTALPVWLESNGETVFPTAFSKARTGDTLTITNIVFCGRYPVRKIESECGTEPVGDRLLVVVLFNGAQPRLLPSSPPVQGGNSAAAFGDTLDSLVCIFGRAIDCIQANQRTDVRELERLQSTMEHSSAEASWGMSELQKFEQTGPEIAFQMSSRDFSTQADLSAVIRDHLSRFVEIVPAGISLSTAPTSITFSSTPIGAEIYVDDNFVGNTPSTVNVQSGRHSITVKKPGFRDWVREMNLSGGTITLVAELVPSSSAQP